jgi:hypothetical protein
MNRKFTVTWKVTFVEASSPREAVRQLFETGTFGALDSGFFEVLDEGSGEKYEVNFSNYREPSSQIRLC